MSWLEALQSAATRRLKSNTAVLVRPVSLRSSSACLSGLTQDPVAHTHPLRIPSSIRPSSLAASVLPEPPPSAPCCPACRRAAPAAANHSRARSGAAGAARARAWLRPAQPLCLRPRSEHRRPFHPSANQCLGPPGRNRPPSLHWPGTRSPVPARISGLLIDADADARAAGGHKRLPRQPAALAAAGARPCSGLH